LRLPWTSDLIQDLSSKYLYIRIRAASALEYLGAEAAIPSLLRSLTDHYSEVRAKAALALGAIGSNKAVPGLLEALKDKKTIVREQAAMALGEINSPVALPYLIQKLDDQSEYVRYHAAEALGKIGSKEAVEALIRKLKDPSSLVRQHAVEALGQIASIAAVEDLIQQFNDPVEIIRKSSAIALAQIGSPLALPHLWKLWLLGTKEYLSSAITAIQNRCQFYNYEIFSSDPEPVPSVPIDLLAKIDQTTQDINQRTKQMAEQPSISIGTISGGIQNFTPNQGTQTNTNIGTQNNYFGADDDLKQQIADLNQFIAELEAKHPHVQTETAANAIIDAEFVAVQTSDINRWQTLRQQMLLLKRQFLNPERQLQALKAGLGEAAKHYLEDSIWAEFIPTYIDKLSEEPNHEA
jgi:HEAT repeats/HEAT repeat/PBS lyase HEAT-like repeat